MPRCVEDEGRDEDAFKEAGRRGGGGLRCRKREDTLRGGDAARPCAARTCCASSRALTATCVHPGCWQCVLSREGGATITLGVLRVREGEKGIASVGWCASSDRGACGWA